MKQENHQPKVDAWGVVYGNRNGTADEMTIVAAYATEEVAESEALNWSFNNDGDPNYFVMPLYRKESAEK